MSKENERHRSLCGLEEQRKAQILPTEPSNAQYQNPLETVVHSKVLAISREIHSHKNPNAGNDRVTQFWSSRCKQKSPAGTLGKLLFICEKGTGSALASLVPVPLPHIPREQTWSPSCSGHLVTRKRPPGGQRPYKITWSGALKSPLEIWP